MRRYGARPDPDRRYTARPGAYAILPRGGRVLVTLQSGPEPELQLPGGGIDPGESAISALHREVEEETGWAIAAPRRVGMFRRFAYLPEYDLHAEKICHVFVARPLLQRGPPTEPGHCALWMPPAAAVTRLANPGDAALLRQVMGRR
ncbi:NUDIX domain-containing protein [Pseudooceanicola aestuarii]|uniref:NUDIX domain-containing protein n=1 Tax=Pseudooceanicola aestuarii TaxID=2697319 RepID=UPI0013D3B463|nr:NUDIX hydrolase [Pseudooceanicola aestuarii]